MTRVPGNSTTKLGTFFGHGSSSLGNDAHFFSGDGRPLRDATIYWGVISGWGVIVEKRGLFYRCCFVCVFVNGQFGLHRVGVTFGICNFQLFNGGRQRIRVLDHGTDRACAQDLGNGSFVGNFAHGAFFPFLTRFVGGLCVRLIVRGTIGLWSVSLFGSAMFCGLFFSAIRFCSPFSSTTVSVFLNGAEFGVVTTAGAATAAFMTGVS